MTKNTERLCADVARCIDGLICETVVLFPANEPAAVDRIVHARNELREAITSLITSAIQDAIEP